MIHSKLKQNSKMILVLATCCWLAACGNNHAFDSAVWLTSDARARGRMCEDLVQRKILVGQSVEEAKRLLGLPDVDYGKVFAYQIDLGWPFKDPKHYGLQVHLDENLNVREVKIVD